MLLRRLGNKAKIAKEIIKYFPRHNIYIEMFFGAGGIFFNKPRVQYNFCNDLDGEVFNLFTVLKDDSIELAKWIELMPIHEDLWEYWKVHIETDPIMKAVRFLFFSNFGYMGKPETLRYHPSTSKQILLNNIQKTLKAVQNVEFMNKDFREVIKSIQFRNRTGIDNAFIYADPPYLGTVNNYSQGFTLQDTQDLFEVLINSGIRFALSEFDNPIITTMAKDYKLNLITIAERQTLQSRQTEVLITNYETTEELFYADGQTN